MHNDARPGLDPFRALDVSRLKLVGQGNWDPLPHLPDELFMAFPDGFVPVWTRESLRETAALAHMWDGLGLLRLTPAFTCYKGPDKDRMIIDRRGQNWAEARLPGPSLFIPVGPMLGMLEVDPDRQSAYCAATDRKDFYHQLRAPDSKSITRSGSSLACLRST